MQGIVCSCSINTRKTKMATKKENNSENEYFTGPSRLSPIPLSVSSPPIQPIDKNKIQAKALETMTHQANQQIKMLKRQADELMKQAKEIENRLKISYQIYQSEIKFKPVIGECYFLYKKGSRNILSLLSPNDWKNKHPYDEFLSEVRLLADQTWEVEKKKSNQFIEQL